MFATTVSTFSINSIALPTWANDFIHSTRKAAAYSSIVFKAFRKTLAPVIATTAKDLSHYYVQCGKGAGQWAMSRAGITHNPLQAAVSAAHAELTSEEAIATYRRIRHIVREAAMDAVVIGLCGVVAVSVGVDVAQKGYRAAAKLFRAIYGRLNPSEPLPTMLPSVGIAIASTEIAEALASFADVAEAEAIAECVPDFWTEPMPIFHMPPVVWPIWNPAPGRNMHEEVARLFELQHVPLTLMPAPVIEPPVPESELEQKPRARARAQAKPELTSKVVDELATALDVPGATGGKQRKPRGKGSTSKAAAKPKEVRAKTGAR